MWKITRLLQTHWHHVCQQIHNWLWQMACSSSVKLMTFAQQTFSFPENLTNIIISDHWWSRSRSSGKIWTSSKQPWISQESPRPWLRCYGIHQHSSTSSTMVISAQRSTTDVTLQAWPRNGGCSGVITLCLSRQRCIFITQEFSPFSCVTKSDLRKLSCQTPASQLAASVASTGASDYPWATQLKLYFHSTHAQPAVKGHVANPTPDGSMSWRRTFRIRNSTCRMQETWPKTGRWWIEVLAMQEHYMDGSSLPQIQPTLLCTICWTLLILLCLQDMNETQFFPCFSSCQKAISTR